MQHSSNGSRRPSKRQLILAAAANHRAWFMTCARAGRGHVCQLGDFTWTHPGHGGGDGHLAFPDLAAACSGELIDTVLQNYRQTEPAVNVMCWATTPSRELGVRLIARGFAKSWQPHWMVVNLTTTAHDLEPPASVTLERAENVPASAWSKSFQTLYAPTATSRVQTEGRLVRHYVALHAGRIIGQGNLHLTDETSSVAGIYNVEVDPAFQRRGVGRALMAWALQEARECGVRHVVLNSTPAGEPLYLSLGFRSLGWGQTWFLRAEGLRSPPATALQVQLAEGVAHGNVEMLVRLAGQLTPEVLANPLPCGATPFELAVQFSRKRVARWLATHGALVDVVSAWDMGWRSEATQVLRNHPELANFKSGAGQKTPLHVAAERNDLDLAVVILAARPDLTATDVVFSATPLAWAEHLGHHDLARLMKRHGANK